VVIAPSHFEAFRSFRVYDGDAYATPLGNVAVDKEFAAKLAKLNPLIQLSSRGHTPTSNRESMPSRCSSPFCSACWVTSNCSHRDGRAEL